MERNTSHLTLPPFSTCSLCRNRLNDLCVEDCAPNIDYRWFEIRKGVNLEEMPHFPLDEFIKHMPPKVRQIVAAVYLSKIVDQLQGRYEYERPHFNHTRVVGVPKNLQVQDLLSGVREEDPVPEDKP